MVLSNYRKYIFPFILYGLTLVLGAGIFKLLEGSVDQELLRLLFRVVLGLLFVSYTIKFVSNKDSLFTLNKVTKEQVGLTLLLCSLFMLNNYYLSQYSEEVSFMNNSNFSLVVLGFLVNSFYEEFAYRGFIQSYVNQHSSAIKGFLSQGNVFASILMTISHLGFFTVMDTVFAITGLTLVLIFSLTMGFIRDKGGSIWLLILIHTLINSIHVMMNLEHYLA